MQYAVMRLWGCTQPWQNMRFGWEPCLPCYIYMNSRVEDKLKIKAIEIDNERRSVGG